jgi:hypothetical protein
MSSVQRRRPAARPRPGSSHRDSWHGPGCLPATGCAFCSALATRIDAPFRDRAPRIERIDGADQIVVEADQILSGIGLISKGARFEAPQTISAQGRFETCTAGVRPLEFGLCGRSAPVGAGMAKSSSKGLSSPNV